MKKRDTLLPDSLLKTIEIDTVSNSRVLNTLTLTGKVDFNEDNVIKIYPYHQRSGIRYQSNDGRLCKKGPGARSHQEFRYGRI